MPLDANATKIRKALFETIAASADQVRATNAADVLARDNALPANLVISAGLHPQWVRAQIGAAAATSIFAVTNCHDADALDDFARQETRVTVLRAIIANECIRPDTLDFCNDRLDFGAPPARPRPDFHEALGDHEPHALPNYEPVEVPEAQQVPAALSRPGFTALNPDSPLGEIPREVLFLSRPAPAIATLLARALALNNVETIAAFVCGYYGPSLHGGKSIKFWNAFASNPLDLLEALPNRYQRYILELLLEEREDDSWAKPLNQWDARLIALMVDTKATCSPNWSPRDGEVFLTPDATTQVIATSRLWPLLYLAPLTPETLPAVFESVRGDVRANLIDNLLRDSTPELMSAALLYDGPGSVRAELGENSFNSIASLLASPDDPATLVAASMAEYDELITYLLVGEDFNDKGANGDFPVPAQVPEIVAFALANINIEIFAEEVRNTRISTMTNEYVRALMDHMPCAWETLLTNSKTSAFVIERIEEVVGVDVAMARLFNQESLEPLTLPEILSRLV
jgi:hypothetical protein